MGRTAAEGDRRGAWRPRREKQEGGETGTWHSEKEKEWVWWGQDLVTETPGVSISGLDSPTVLEMDALEHGISLLVNMQ